MWCRVPSPALSVLRKIRKIRLQIFSVTPSRCFLCGASPPGSWADSKWEPTRSPSPKSHPESPWYIPPLPSAFSPNPISSRGSPQCPSQLGTHSCISAPLQIPLQLFVYGPLCDAIGAVKALRCAVSVGVFLLFFPCVRYLGQHTLGLQVATSLFMALRRWGMGDGETGCMHLGDLMGVPFLFLTSSVLGVYFYVVMCIRSRIGSLPHCSMNSSY